MIWYDCLFLHNAIRENVKLPPEEDSTLRYRRSLNLHRHQILAHVLEPGVIPHDVAETVLALSNGVEPMAPMRENLILQFLILLLRISLYGENDVLDASICS